MKSTTYLPGPWTLEQDGETEFALVDESRSTHFDVKFPLEFTEARILPTMRLLEAAPELHQIACDVMQLDIVLVGDDGFCRVCRQRARLCGEDCLRVQVRNVLAKVRGEAVPA